MVLQLKSCVRYRHVIHMPGFPKKAGPFVIFCMTLLQCVSAKMLEYINYYDGQMCCTTHNEDYVLLRSCDFKQQLLLILVLPLTDGKQSLDRTGEVLY